MFFHQSRFQIAWVHRFLILCKLQFEFWPYHAGAYEDFYLNKVCKIYYKKL